MYYVNSFPRSGNTWIRELLISLLSASPLDVNPIWQVGKSNTVFAVHPVIPNSILKEKEHRIIVKSHGKGDVCQPEIPVVYIVRDGRDAMYSYYHFNIDHRDHRETWEQYFSRHVVDRSMVTDREIYLDAWMGNWSENVMSYLNRKNTIIVKYEDLREETLVWIKKILEFLGLELLKDTEINRHISFFSEKLDQKRNTHQRKRGEIFGWKHIYTDEQKQQFEQRHSECLALLNYESC